MRCARSALGRCWRCLGAGAEGTYRLLGPRKGQGHRVAVGEGGHYGVEFQTVQNIAKACIGHAQVLSIDPVFCSADCEGYTACKVHPKARALRPSPGRAGQGQRIERGDGIIDDLGARAVCAVTQGTDR